jgi:hypothetical protein
VAKAKDKAGLKLVTAEAQDVEARFRELYDKANKNLPSGVASAAAKAAGEDLRQLLCAHPTEKLWDRIPGPLKVARDFALEHSPGVTPGVRACWGVAQRRFTKACETLERVRMMRRRAGQVGEASDAGRRRA